MMILPARASRAYPRRDVRRRCSSRPLTTHRSVRASEVAAARTTGLGEAASIRDVRQVLNDLNQRVRSAANEEVLVGPFGSTPIVRYPSSMVGVFDISGGVS